MGTLEERSRAPWYAVPAVGLGLTVALVVYAFLVEPPRPIQRAQSDIAPSCSCLCSCPDCPGAAQKVDPK